MRKEIKYRIGIIIVLAVVILIIARKDNLAG